MSQHRQRSTPWPEVRYAYSSALRARYRKGALLRKWIIEYKICPLHSLFHKDDPEDRRLPPHRGYGFNEYFMGTRYRDAGYEVLLAYLEGECGKCYKRAKELFGGDRAAKFIAKSEHGGRAPDLIVFHPRTLTFRFVECKGQREPFTEKQPKRFTVIEKYLNENPPPCKGPLTGPDCCLFPKLPKARWIHVARLIEIK